MKYSVRDYDGEVIVVKTTAELVSVIREYTPFIDAASDDEFMKKFAAQICLQSGDEVRSDTADNFVEDLIGIGFLKEIAENDKKQEDA
jgi:hypothetical protein